MAFHGILEYWLDGEHPLIDRCWIIPIESNHLGTSFAAPDDLECTGLDALDRGVDCLPDMGACRRLFGVNCHRLHPK